VGQISVPRSTIKGARKPCATPHVFVTNGGEVRRCVIPDWLLF
jgi:hypothetical protein